ncbi:MAG: multiprotein-bridging factor 1 family protein [Paracoccaceae bacterium]
MTTDEEFDWGEDASTFGDRLARAREAAGMDQQQLARRLGVKLTTVGNWEDDRSEPRANRLQMLTGLLGVSIVWLLTGQGEGGPSEEVDNLSEDADAASLLAELRALRLAQNKLADRTGRVEKRLRNLLGRS